MEKIYNKPEINLIMLENTDIITTSNPNQSGGDTVGGGGAVLP